MKKILFLCVLFLSSFAHAQESDQTNTNKQSNSMFMQVITVTIGGNFIVTGSFTASRLQRLDHFVTSIFTEAQTKTMGSLNKIEVIKQVSEELKKYPLRDIILRHVNGETEKIDLLKFRLTGDFKYNPYLKMDDVLIFPSYDLKRDIVDISGAVNKPGTFQFVEGDKLSDAILFAGGINMAFDNVKEVEISRVADFGQKEDIIKTTIEENPPLKRGDRITVLYKENYKKIYKMLVLGEVNRPGYVYIINDHTTLKEVIEKAGGFTVLADLRHAEFLRGTDPSQVMKISSLRQQYERDSSNTTWPVVKKSIEELKTEEIKMMRSGNITPLEFENSFALDNTLRFIESKNIVDFNEIYSDTSAVGNMTVKEGDLVVVPTFNNSIYVFGQVKSPGYYNLMQNKNWKYYIDEAGGYTERAKSESDIRIIKGDSRSWLEVDDNYKLEGGDFIYVPKALNRDLSYYISLIGAASSILSTIVTLTFIIIQTTKK